MKLQSLFPRITLFVFFMLLFLGAPRVDAQSNPQSAATFQAQAVPARITQAVDETQLVRLKGNVHPLARPEFDQGAIPDSTPMNRMLLLLQRSPDQEAALQQLMAEQQAKDSPNFHKWLTPQQFGAQFGPADADIQTVTDWLTRQGFHGIKVAAGKTAIEFSGTAGQVRNAFQAEIRRYRVNGQARQANASDPQIPAALTPVVAGIVSLHNFPRKSMKHDAGIFVAKKESSTKPQFTTSSGCGASNASPCFVVGPADFAKIYNLPPTATLDGTGVTIALVADSNIDPNDVAAFRSLFGLSSNFTSSNIILNGPDPGLNGDEGEADLDAQTAGMVAPGATVNLVVSEDTLTAAGIDLSALYIIDNNIASVMSESFGVCEPALGIGGNSFYGSIWEEAAAQGISVMVSAGDNGSAGCDDFTSQATATNGLAVSGIASTPFNVAVGGTDFDDAGTQMNFWNSSTNNAAGTRESAKGYIPEIPWNDSCAAAATSSNLNTVCANPNGIAAGSGGPSAFYTKTQATWQTGITPADGSRDLPDISLFASDGLSSNSFYLFCEADLISAGSPPSCTPDAQGHFSFFGAGGTSASSPAFAGIMALIVQQQAGGRQGNPNPILYAIAKNETFASCNSSTMPLTGSATCVFYDVTKNTNSVPCTGATLNCSSNAAATTGVLVDPAHTTTPAWTTAAGYDMATGLGSVNVTNLAAAWKTTVGAFTSSTTITKINGGTSLVSIPHGQAVTLSATVTGASGTPTGDVSFVAPTTVDGGIASATLTSGTASVTVPSAVFTGLPGGSYNLKAHYAGDGTFAPSDDPTGVPVNVATENSGLLAEMVTFDSLGNITSTNATTLAYGSGPFFRIDILNHTGTASNCQPLVINGVTTGCAFDATGSVTITDNGAALPGSPFTINSAGHLEDQTIQLTGGAHTLVATYPGDISYNAPASPTTYTVTVTPAVTATAVAPSPASGVTTSTPVTLTATISSQSISTTGATGNVAFKDGTTTIGTVAAVPTGANAVSFAGATATLTQTFSTTGTHSITAAYAGDQNYATSTSTAVNVTVASSGSFTIGGSASTVTAGSSATSSITVTPTGGFTGMVNVTCPAANLPPGVTCSPNPLAINVTSASPVANNLTVAVAAPSSTTSASILPADRTLQWAGLAPLTGGGKGWWGLSAITGLAAILLVLLPGRRRYRAALPLGLICLLSFTLGCSGGYGGGGGGTSATTTKISVTSTKVASGTSIAFSVTVTSTGTRMPTGSVQLYDGTAVLGTAGTLASGSTTINISTLAVGTHAINAHYLADAYSTASQSGTLNITITGSTTFAVTASPAASNGSPAVNLTIN
jgi:pro-kumamolisin-like protein/Big-like domain-containing protein